MRPVIKFRSDPAFVQVSVSDASVEHEFSGDVIADVNQMGNWIRGLELLGSGLSFSIQQALAPFGPKPSASSVLRVPSELAVTYDENANAGFLYLPYAFPAALKRELHSNPLLLQNFRSIEDDNATFGLAASKALVFVRFAIPSSERLDRFLQLFGCDSPKCYPGSNVDTKLNS